MCTPRFREETLQQRTNIAQAATEGARKKLRTSYGVYETENPFFSLKNIDPHRFVLCILADFSLVTLVEPPNSGQVGNRSGGTVVNCCLFWRVILVI